MTCVIVGVICGAIGWIAARASLPGPDFPIWSESEDTEGREL